MTPGPIAINAATFVGTRLAGVPGALTATPGCILPSCLLLTLLSRLYLRYRQCHQLKTGAFVLCEKTAKQMQLVGAGLCSARQDTPNYRKSSANPYALTRLAVEANAHIGPAECTVFTELCGEFAAAQWADRVVGPYGAYLSAAPCRGGRLCPPADCTAFFCNLRQIRNFPTGRCGHRPLQITRKNCGMNQTIY